MIPFTKAVANGLRIHFVTALFCIIRVHDTWVHSLLFYWNSKFFTVVCSLFLQDRILRTVNRAINMYIL